MRPQEINIIVTVKNDEELVYQVASLPKKKLEQLGNLKTGRVFVKSHVACQTCSDSLELNVFFTQPMPVSTVMLKHEIKEEDEVIDAEYLMDEPLEEQIELKVEEEDTNEIVDENVEPKKSKTFENKTEKTTRSTKKPRASNKFDIPDNDLVRKLEKNRVCDFCDFKRRRKNCNWSRTNFLGHCALHLMRRKGHFFNCLACGHRSILNSDAKNHALSCKKREEYRQKLEKNGVEPIKTDLSPLKNIKTETKPKKPRKIEKILCHICSKYIMKRFMEEHMIKHNTGTTTPFACHHCGKKSSCLDNLRKHLIVKHFRHLAKFQCPQCPSVFTQSHLFESHKKIHQKIEKITCPLCGISVVSEKNLKKHHFNVHTDPSLKQKFQCEHCDKIFFDKGGFKVHTFIHLPEDQLPFKCQICGKGSIDSFKHKRHLLEHKNPELILRECKICGKGFKYANSLTVHMRQHTGEQPYECKFCDRSFADRSHHRLHMKKHETEMGIKLTLTAEERRLVNVRVYQPEDLVSSFVK